MLAGSARAASGGMMGTALIVYVGRDGSPFAVSMLATLFFVSTMLFSPLWGALGDLTGRHRTVLIAANTMASVMALSLLLVQSVWGLVGMRGLYAVFAVGFGPLMLSIVGTIAGPNRRGRATGFFNSAIAAGSMGGQALVGILLGVLAPSGLYLVIATVSFLGVLAVLLLDDPDVGADVVPVDAPSGTPTTALTIGALVSAVRTRLVPDSGERRHLRESGLAWLYVALALRHVTVKGVGSLVPIYLITNVGVSAVTMGLLLALAPAAQIGFNALFGRIADIRGRKWLIVFGIVASGLYAVGLAAASLPAGVQTGLLIAGLGFIAIAAGFSAMDIGVVAVIGDTVSKERESSFIGLRSTAGGVGGVIGPTVVGVVALFSTVRTAFFVASVFAFVSALIVVRTLAEPDRSAQPELIPLDVETGIGINRPAGIHRGVDVSTTGDDD